MSDGIWYTNTANGFVTTYAYDQAGRLRTFTGKDTAGAALTQTYGYDGLGTRRWRQAANVRTHHTWDPSGELALIIQDGSTSYIYGPEDVPIEQILVAAGTWMSLSGGAAAMALAAAKGAAPFGARVVAQVPGFLLTLLGPTFCSNDGTQTNLGKS